jgi:hypothetical protein
VIRASAVLARLPKSLDVLRVREFRLLFSGQAVSVLGDRMVAVALAFAVLEVGGSTSDVGLVLAAGVLVAAAGAGWAIAADAVTFAVSATCLVMLRVPTRVAARTSSFVADLREGWVAFRSRRWVWARRRRPRPRRRGRVGHRPCGATQVKPRRPLVFVALTDGLFALPLAFLAANPPVALLACSALLSGAGMMLGISVWESTLQRHIPGGSLSRVSSYDWFGSLAFSPLGLAIWGPVAAAIGIDVSLWLAFGLPPGATGYARPSCQDGTPLGCGPGLAERRRDCFAA